MFEVCGVRNDQSGVNEVWLYYYRTIVIIITLGMCNFIV